MRANGFQKPFNGMQISTWILIPLLLIHFSLFCVTVLPPYLSITTSILYYFFGVCSVYFGWLTSKTDSIDEKLSNYMKSCNQSEFFREKNADLNSDDELQRCQKVKTETCNHVEIIDDKNNNSEKYCWVCKVQVHQQSMHCKFCDKCVSHFDHHCMWLNTCIGKANYRYFYKTIMFTFLFVMVHSITLSLTVIFYFVNTGDINRRIVHFLETLDIPVMAIVCVNTGFFVTTLGLSLIIMQLLIFHIRLQKDKITTYEFILRDSQRRKDESILQSKVQRMRSEAIILAKTQGNIGHIFRIKLHELGIFKNYDPIRRQIKSNS